MADEEDKKFNDYMVENKTEEALNNATVPWTVCFFCHTRDKTCSGGSTSSPCSHLKVAPPAQDKTDGKAHSTLGKTASAKSHNDKERFHFHCSHSRVDVS